MGAKHCIDREQNNGIHRRFLCYFCRICVNVYQQNDLEKPILQTAFDVAESPRKLLRYGFLSDFTEKDRDNGALEWLLKCHINLIQFYDWSYRHDSLVAPQEDYHDMMGKEISGSTVKAKSQRQKRWGCTQPHTVLCTPPANHFLKSIRHGRFTIPVRNRLYLLMCSIS